MGLGRTRDLHGGAGRGDHQHTVVGAEHLVVDVHAGVVVTRIMARLLWLVCVDTAILPSAAYA